MHTPDWLAGKLVVVGSDIRETVPVFLGTDNRCNPSGGSRTRLWHWNGTRLAPSAWTYPQATHLDSFLSPDRKVWCRIIKGYGENDAWCGTMAPERLATVRPNGAVTICEGSTPGDCLQNWDAKAAVLHFGQQSTRNGFRCFSASNGITCTVIAGAGKGKGFLINAAGATKIG